MEYVYIGKIVGTHGIKGELKILSDFEFKDRVFGEFIPIYIGEEKEEHVFKTHRVHKTYDMITLDGYNDINEVLKFVKSKVYCNKEDLHLDKKTVLDSDLIGYNTYCRGECLGKVIEVFNSGGGNKVIKTKEYMFPYRKELFAKFDTRHGAIHLKSLEAVVECESTY